MKKLVIFLFIYFPLTHSQILDSNYVLKFDNASGDPIMNTDSYKEFAPPGKYFFTNNGNIFFGGNTRRFPVPDSTDYNQIYAQFISHVDSPGNYLVYNFNPSPISKGYITIKKNSTSSTSIDSLPIIGQESYSSKYAGLWNPLTTVQIIPGDSTIISQLGFENSSGIMRADGIILLRNYTSFPNIEFGQRYLTRIAVDPNTGDTLINKNFLLERAPVEFPETISLYDYQSEKKVPLFNIGNAPLIISKANFFKGYDYSLSSQLPISILPGEKFELIIRFNPTTSDSLIDTLTLATNDPEEPDAKIVLKGKGVPFYFILNASENSVEPHFNAVFPVSYIETGNWENFPPSNLSYPIPDGNLNSRRSNNGSFRFTLNFPDTLPQTEYHLHYSGPTTGTASTHVNIFFGYEHPNILIRENFDQTELTGWEEIGTVGLFGHTNYIIEFINNSTNYMYSDLLKFSMAEITPHVKNDYSHYKYYLDQNYPNPFNPVTKIKFSIPDFGFVNLRVYNILGKEIAKLVSEEKAPGQYEVEFDASHLSSGVYFYKLTSRDFNAAKKFVLMK